MMHWSTCSPTRRILALAVALSLAMLSAPVLAHGIAQSLSGWVSEGNYQVQLPQDVAKTEQAIESRPGTGPDRAAISTKASPRDLGNDSNDEYQGPGPISQVILWMLGFTGAALAILYLMSSTFPGLAWLRRFARFGDFPPPATVVSWPPATAPPEMHAIEKLAEMGLFTEAVHRLLVLLWKDLQRDAKHHVGRSMTSRELVRAMSLPLDVTSALTSMINTVEVSHFGGRTVAQSDWVVCRGSYVEIRRRMGLSRG